MKGESHYPSYDVMKEKEYWDEHTRSIVEDRLQPHPYTTLSLEESILLTQVCARLLDERRDSILHYVVYYFDQLLASDIGESQRKVGVPKASVLIRQGIRAIDHYATITYGKLFAGLTEEEQQDVLSRMADNAIELYADGIQIPAQELFMKLLSEAVSAYYSHPTVWSEIGYGGPAYPRGYVRSQLGLCDPWEAKRLDETAK